MESKAPIGGKTPGLRRERTPYMRAFRAFLKAAGQTPPPTRQHRLWLVRNEACIQLAKADYAACSSSLTEREEARFYEFAEKSMDGRLREIQDDDRFVRAVKTLSRFGIISSSKGSIAPEGCLDVKFSVLHLGMERATTLVVGMRLLNEVVSEDLPNIEHAFMQNLSDAALEYDDRRDEEAIERRCFARK